MKTYKITGNRAQVIELLSEPSHNYMFLNLRCLKF